MLHRCISPVGQRVDRSRTAQQAKKDVGLGLTSENGDQGLGGSLFDGMCC